MGQTLNSILPCLDNEDQIPESTPLPSANNHHISVSAVPTKTPSEHWVRDERGCKTQDGSHTTVPNHTEAASDGLYTKMIVIQAIGWKISRVSSQPWAIQPYQIRPTRLHENGPARLQGAKRHLPSGFVTRQGWWCRRREKRRECQRTRIVTYEREENAASCVPKEWEGVYVGSVYLEEDGSLTWQTQGREPRNWSSEISALMHETSGLRCRMADRRWLFCMRGI